MARKFFTKYGELIKKYPVKAWLIVYCVWLVDYFSTIIAVGMHYGDFFEGNPIAAWFFSLGMMGWILWAICCGILIWTLIRFPFYAEKINLIVVKKKKDIKKIKFTFNNMRVIFFCLVILSETCVIIHNVYLLCLHFI